MHVTLLACFEDAIGACAGSVASVSCVISAARIQQPMRASIAHVSHYVDAKPCAGRERAINAAGGRKHRPSTR